MNFSLALAETPREILIDGTRYLLVRKSALDALYASTGAGDRAATQGPSLRASGDRPHESRPARTAHGKASRPAPKKSKAASSRSPVARSAAAPDPEAPKPVSGALRGAVLAEIQASPGRTSLELFDVISKKIPTTTSGSVYQSAKALVRDGLVKGQPTDEGTIGWHPAR